jgi:hypothetical protein
MPLKHYGVLKAVPVDRRLGTGVNTVETPEDETVTLLNTSPLPIDLTGWALADSQPGVPVFS